MDCMFSQSFSLFLYISTTETFLMSTEHFLISSIIPQITVLSFITKLSSRLIPGNFASSLNSAFELINKS